MPKHLNALDQLLANDNFDADVFFKESASMHTTYKCGGDFKYYVVAHSIFALQSLLRAAYEVGIPYYMIGKGSNLLVSDDGFDGVVISLGNDFRYLNYDENLSTVTCGAGVSFARLCQFAFTNSLSGLEFAVGIPGTIGGALCMNAGTGGVGIGDVVKSISILDVNDNFSLKNCRGEEMEWSYHSSSLYKNAIALECKVSLKKYAGADLQMRMDEKLKSRNAKQPLGFNCGSVFKNPEGDYAARLIEECGLKGRRIGGAEICEKHANFFSNVDAASASDVKALIDLAQDRVYEKFQIKLEPEVKLLGF